MRGVSTRSQSSNDALPGKTPSKTPEAFPDKTSDKTGKKIADQVIDTTDVLSLVHQAVTAALDKKADDLVLLDMREKVSFTDYFLLCTAYSPPQVRAVADAVEKALRQRGVRPTVMEGYRNGEWVLVDYLDFVVHVFSKQARAFYELERLWRHAPRVPLSAVGAGVEET